MKKRIGKLPPVLLLQLDNTTKSCKGRWLLAWLALLVHSRAFNKILVSFLPVGHTHEDIDQFFSRISKTLRKTGAHSRIMLAERIKQAYTHGGVPPVVSHWESVGNMSGWLEGRVKALTDMTAFQQFRLFRSSSDEKVWLQGRVWPGAGEDDHWGGFTRNDTHVQMFIPAGVYPDLVAEYALVPGTARAETQPGTEVLRKVRKGLDQMFTYLKVLPRDVEDCNHVYDLYSSPPEVEIPFDWDRDSVAEFFGGAGLQSAQALVQVAPAAPSRHVNSQGEVVTLNSFQLMKPADEDISATYPFGIRRIKHLLHTSEGEAVAHTQEWQLVDGEDPITGKYKVNLNQTDGQSRQKYPLLKMDEGFQATINLTLKSKTTAQIFATSASKKGQSLAQYYACRFAHPEEMQVDPAEIMNQAGYEHVQPPVRQPRRSGKDALEEKKADVREPESQLQGGKKPSAQGRKQNQPRKKK